MAVFAFLSSLTDSADTKLKKNADTIIISLDTGFCFI